MCIGPNVMLKPTSMIQNEILPQRSLSIRPNTFGHQ